MKLKVCGLKYPDNIRQIAELDPDYLGFVFYEGSKRFVGYDFIMPELPENIQKVGVFVNATTEYIFENIKKHKLHFVQLHGDESSEYCSQIAKRIPVIKAFGIDKNFNIDLLSDYKSVCSFFLFDGKTAVFDGSAQPFNWEFLKSYDNSVPYFISGGMDLEKFRRVEGLNLPVFGIDVNSKFEIKPGYKDIIKVIQIKNNIR